MAEKDTDEESYGSTTSSAHPCPQMDLALYGHAVEDPRRLKLPAQTINKVRNTGIRVSSAIWGS